MKRSEAVPGTKVIASYHYEDYSYPARNEVIPYVYDEYSDNELVGVIRSQKASRNKVWVKWIEGDLADDKDHEVELKVLSLEAERSRFEQDFKKFEKQVEEKMKAAATLVNQAGKLAKKAHVRSLERMYSAVSPLVDAMDSNGWRSSSWGC